MHELSCPINALHLFETEIQMLLYSTKIPIGEYTKQIAAAPENILIGEEDEDCFTCSEPSSSQDS